MKINPKGSPSDSKKKRSYASAELQESPTKVVRSIERSFKDVSKAIDELCNKLYRVSIEKKIVLPLLKVYRYAKTKEPPSKVAKRKVDISMKESNSQQYAGPSHVLASEKAELNLTGAESEKVPASDRTSDEYRNICLPNSFSEDCKKLWDLEYRSFFGAGTYTRFNPQIDVILSLFRQLVYLEQFFRYNCLESESSSSRRHCRESEIPLVDCGDMVSRIDELEIDWLDVDSELMSSWSDEQCTLEIFSLCDKEQEIVNVLLQVTKRILHYYFHRNAEFIPHLQECREVISDVVDTCEIVRTLCTCSRWKQLSSDYLDLFTYLKEIDFQVRKIGVCLDVYSEHRI